MADPVKLADAILILKEDEKLRKRTAENGYKLFKEKLNPTSVGKEPKAILRELT